MTAVTAPTGPAGGRLDLLVNNAASFERGDFRTRSDADLRRVLEVNLVAPVSLARGLAPALTAASGSIVNILDVAGYQPWRGYLDHCTAKAGLAMATRALAGELAPAVRVNGVAPGTVAWPEDDPRFAADSPVRAAILRAIPLAAHRHSPRYRPNGAVPGPQPLHHRPDDRRGRRPAAASVPEVRLKTRLRGFAGPLTAGRDPLSIAGFTHGRQTDEEFSDYNQRREPLNAAATVNDHRPVTGRPLEVKVDERGVERAIRKLRRLMASEGVLREIKRRRHYEKPSVKMKRKLREAERRRKRRQRKRIPMRGEG
jgi:small subunit ribosomal protein S21